MKKGAGCRGEKGEKERCIREEGMMEDMEMRGGRQGDGEEEEYRRR